MYNPNAISTLFSSVTYSQYFAYSLALFLLPAFISINSQSVSICSQIFCCFVYMYFASVYFSVSLFTPMSHILLSSSFFSLSLSIYLSLCVCVCVCVREGVCVCVCESCDTVCFSPLSQYVSLLVGLLSYLISIFPLVLPSTSIQPVPILYIYTAQHDHIFLVSLSLRLCETPVSILWSTLLH